MNTDNNLKTNVNRIPRQSANPKSVNLHILKGGVFKNDIMEKYHTACIEKK